MTAAVRQRVAAVLPCGAVFAAAALARLAVTFRYGVFRVGTGYDASVYFAASDALLHGRLPYSGFVLLHPPGLMLALSPFAALTYVLPDWLAYGIATIGFALLGAVNAVLVVRLAQRCGIARSAALAGGAFYAVWFGAVSPEHVTKLEPLGNFLFLIGLMFATEAHRRPQPTRPALCAGAVLGLAVSVKIWWVVPLAAVVAWSGLVTHRRVVAGQMLGGAALAAALVNLPFFLAAPRAMWTSVIVDQIRRRPAAGPLHRLGDLTTLPQLVPAVRGPAIVIGACVMGALAAHAAVRAARLPIGRVALALLGAQLAVLLLAPPWFTYYDDYVAVPLALTIAAAAVPAGQRPGVHRAAWLPVAAAGAVTALVIGLATAVATPFHGAATLSRGVQRVRCVMSDSPMALIELNALSRGLAAGCPDWIDDTGRTYGRDRGSPRRSHNRLWQRDATHYLRSGGAVILLRGRASGLDPRTRRAITRDGLLEATGGHRVYWVDNDSASNS